jgi:putative hydrolase of the HAD superfamily
VPLVIFDLDNTLIDREVPLWRWAAQFVAEYALEPGEVQWLVSADGDGFVPRPRFLSAVRERYGLDEPLDVLLDSFRDQIVALVDLDPQVPLVLDRLRREGWRVAIATNGSTAQQSAKIQRTGLDSHIDALAISEEVGFAKPDPRMFQVAAQRCGTRLEDGGWMVGDCPARDVAGGQNVGLRTIWMRRGRTWDPDARAPDAIVDEVAGAVAVLTSSAPIA